MFHTYEIQNQFLLEVRTSSAIQVLEGTKVVNDDGAGITPSFCCSSNVWSRTNVYESGRLYRAQGFWAPSYNWKIAKKLHAMVFCRERFVFACMCLYILEIFKVPKSKPQELHYHIFSSILIKLLTSCIGNSSQNGCILWY